MESNGTDPDLSSLLLRMLNAWRYDTPIEDVPFGLSQLLERQLGIGLQYLLEGWLSWDWEATQQAYYLIIQDAREKDG
jgi:hypothetical protein